MTLTPNQRPTRLIIIALMALSLSACITPAADPPVRDMQDFSGAFNASLSEDTEASMVWWDQFNDARLGQLVKDALTNNASLDAAAANVKAAQAIAGGARLNQSFSTNTNADLDVSRAPSFGQDVDVALNVGLGAIWEYDAFGRIAAQIRAAELGVQAAENTRKDLAVIIASETALAYTDLRGAQRRLSVARQNAEAQLEGLELLNTLLDNGRATRLDIERAEAQYRTTLASIPGFEAGVSTAISRLAALTGTPANMPGSKLTNLQNQSADIPEHAGAILTGDVAGLIRRRPDIRQAETLIEQRLALGEVERARLFPTITFNANVFTLFNQANDIGDASSIGFGIGPAIRWDGPDLRRVRASIDVADAQTEAALATYEQTILNALSEVEIALTEYAKEGERRSDLVQAAQSARRSLELARLRFEEGLDDYLDVLDAQRTLLDAEDRLAESRLQTTRRAISAYRALGGVWSNRATMPQNDN